METCMTPMEHARSQADAAVDRLLLFLRIPSVSAVPEHAEDMRRAAAWVAGLSAALSVALFFKG